MFSYNNDKNNTNNGEAGFIILIVPVLLLLFGFFVSSIIRDTKPNQFYLEVTTQHKLKDVQTALATYAHRHYRVPCPANPSGVGNEDNALDANQKCSRKHGILPYKTLGLSENDAKDEWGNFLTYKISPDFTTKLDSTNTAQFTEVGLASDPLLVASSGEQNQTHELCRTENWIDKDKEDYISSNGNAQTIAEQNINKHLYKARFCCASNKNGGGLKNFLAVDQVPQLGGKTIDLDSDDGDNAGDGIIKLSVAPLDRDIALWDESAVRCGWNGDCGTIQSWAIDGSIARAASRTFDYNTGYEAKSRGDEGLGDGIGPRRTERTADGRYIRSEDHSGKFYWTAALFEVTDDTQVIQKMDFAMSDVGSNNEGDSIQTTIEIVDLNGDPILDLNGDPIETVSVVLALPKEPVQGVGSMKFSLDMFEGESDQEGLYHEGVDVRWKLSDGSFGEAFQAPASNAEDLFNQSKARLMAALNDSGLTLDDVKIKSMKINSTHASLGFSSMSFGSLIDNTDTDLKVEAGFGSRLQPRNPAAYETSNTLTTSGVAIDQTFEAPAYVIISHGPNGEGAFTGNSDTDQVSNIDDALENPDELINHTHITDPNDPNYGRIRDLPKMLSNTTVDSFDDIIMWDSQVTLYNALRNGTCEESQAL